MFILILGGWWDALSNTQQVFWGIAIVFSVLFLIQFVLSLIGLEFSGDADFDFHGDADGHGGFSVDHDFTLLSVRSIIAFFTFFGWVGVLVLNNGGSTISAVGFASLAGFAAMVSVAYIMYLFSKLEQDGNLDIQEAVYQSGEVYLPIPANKNGAGLIHINLGGSLREMEAVTNGDAIQTGSKVRVVDIINENILLVEQSEHLLEGGK